MNKNLKKIKLEKFKDCKKNRHGFQIEKFKVCKYWKIENFQIEI